MASLVQMLLLLIQMKENENSMLFDGYTVRCFTHTRFEVICTLLLVDVVVDVVVANIVKGELREKDCE